MGWSVTRWVLVTSVLGLLSFRSAWADYDASRQAFLREDYQTAFQECIAAANAGNANCQNAMGVLVKRGLGVVANPEAAFRWFFMAAEKNHPQARYNLGLMYEAGEGVEKSLSEAKKQFRKAAEAGHLKAQTNLGNLFAAASAGTPDWQQARFWWGRAAEGGDPMAQNNLGWAFLNGAGGEVDPIRARIWLERAATQVQDAAARDFARQNLRRIAQPTGGQTSPDVGLVLDVRIGEVGDDGQLTIGLQSPKDVQLRLLRVGGREVEAAGRERIDVVRYVPIGSSQIEIYAEDAAGKWFRRSYDIQRTAPVASTKLPELDPSRMAGATHPDAVAIVIGAERYESMPHADYADNDARAFFDYANKALGVRPEKIKLLAGTAARRSELLQVLRHWLGAEVNAGRTDVFVFYAGHGLASADGKKRYLLPLDAKLDLLDDTALSQQQLIDIITSHRPRSVTMMFDSCFSGARRGGGSLLAALRPIAIESDYGPLPSNVTLISSSSGSQMSAASNELRHGLFSYFLMKGLEGDADADSDGKITAQELHGYLQTRVSKEAMRRGVQQVPAIYGLQDHVLVTSNK